MSVRLRAAVAIASIAAVTVLSENTAAQAATPGTTTEPAAAAAGWLSRQLVGGNHLVTTYNGTSYADYGGTADAVFALSAAKVGRSAIEAATGWLAKNADAYSSVSDTSNAPGPYDGALGKLALVAEVTGQNPADFGGYDLLKALHNDQCTAAGNADGSDSSKPLCPAPGAARNIYSSVSESLVILAESRAGGSNAPTPDAVDYFLSLQCPNGGFTGSTGACTDNTDASVDETAYAAMALAALGSQPAALAKAVGWLAAQRDSSGNWVVQGGPDVDSTGLAAAALAAAGKDVSSSRGWLAAQQVQTGPTLGTGAARGALKYQGAFDPISSVKATSDGLLGLGTDGSLATLTDSGAAADAPVLALATPRMAAAAVARGADQTVTGTGFAAGERVRAVLHSNPVRVGTAAANAKGAVSVRFAVPAGAALGAHTVELTGLSSGLTVSSAPFTVSAASTPAPTGSGSPSSGATAVDCNDPTALACTGRDGRQTRGELVLGAGLVLAGAGALWLGRHRRA